MAVDPQGSDIQRFVKEDPGGPVVILNLVRFKEGGRAAYDAYASAVMPILLKVGGQPLYAGDGSTGPGGRARTDVSGRGAAGALPEPCGLPADGGGPGRRASPPAHGGAPGGRAPGHVTVGNVARAVRR